MKNVSLSKQVFHKNRLGVVRLWAYHAYLVNKQKEKGLPNWDKVKIPISKAVEDLGITRYTILKNLLFCKRAHKEVFVREEEYLYTHPSVKAGYHPAGLPVFSPKVYRTRFKPELFLNVLKKSFSSFPQRDFLNSFIYCPKELSKIIGCSVITTKNMISYLKKKGMIKTDVMRHTNYKGESVIVDTVTLLPLAYESEEKINEILGMRLGEKEEKKELDKENSVDEKQTTATPPVEASQNSSPAVDNSEEKVVQVTPMFTSSMSSFYEIRNLFRTF